jgi:hypothetical protein
MTDDFKSLPDISLPDEFRKGVAFATQCADTEIARLRNELDEIGRLALGCWMDMQGRLVDDEHRRAHGVLANISVKAALALEKPNE